MTPAMERGLVGLVVEWLLSSAWLVAYVSRGPLNVWRGVHADARRHGHTYVYSTRSARQPQPEGPASDVHLVVLARMPYAETVNMIRCRCSSIATCKRQTRNGRPAHRAGGRHSHKAAPAPEPNTMCDYYCSGRQQLATVPRYIHRHRSD